MILKIVCTLLGVLIIGYIVNLRENYIKINKKKISFKEAMDLVDLPIITLYHNDKKLNFLLDTGSNYSHISKEASQYITGELVNSTMNITGVGEGDISSSNYIKTTLAYKTYDYNIELYITPNLDASFAAVKAESGVQIHGIIGNAFFQEHKYILDFKDLVAYSK